MKKNARQPALCNFAATFFTSQGAKNWPFLTLTTRPLAPGFPSEMTLARLVTRHCIAAETPADLHWQVVEKQSTTQFAAEVPTAARRAIVVATDAWLAPMLAGVGGDGSELIRLADLARAPGKAAIDAGLARMIVGQPEFRTPMAELGALLGARARPEAFAARHEAVAVRSLKASTDDWNAAAWASE